MMNGGMTNETGTTKPLAHHAQRMHRTRGCLPSWFHLSLPRPRRHSLCEYRKGQEKGKGRKEKVTSPLLFPFCFFFFLSHRNPNPVTGAPRRVLIRRREKMQEQVACAPLPPFPFSFFLFCPAAQRPFQQVRLYRLTPTRLAVTAPPAYSTFSMLLNVTCTTHCF